MKKGLIIIGVILLVFVLLPPDSLVSAAYPSTITETTSEDTTICGNYLKCVRNCESANKKYYYACDAAACGTDPPGTPGRDECDSSHCDIYEEKADDCSNTCSISEVNSGFLEDFSLLKESCLEGGNISFKEKSKETPNEEELKPKETPNEEEQPKKQEDIKEQIMNYFRRKLKDIKNYFYSRIFQ